MALATACSEGTADRRRGGAVPDWRNPDDAASTLPVLEPQPPWFSLAPGARYFERDGIQAPFLMRNVSAPSVEAFTPLFAAASQAGTSVVRLQLSQGFGYQTLGMTNQGGVLSSWAAAWDSVFDEAERQGLAVIPVFTLWGDWNDGTPPLGWTHYDANPLASARGGPAASPADLFADTEAQQVWLGWLSALVARWSSRPSVIAWEIFSELDLASGVTREGASAFLEKAHRVVRDIEPWRPAFASTSDLPLISGEPWQTLWDSAGNDLVSIHPYAADLDREASDRVRSVADGTSKPVFVGESGLDAAPPEGETLSSAPRAAAGLGHAIWAELVSGAASARALYWEDGYAVYYPATGLPFVTQHQDLEREAANWLAGKDFRGRVPVRVRGEPALFGGAMADGERVSGWARNDLLSPPEWSAPPLERARVEVFLPPGSVDAEWVVTTTSPEDGSVAELAGSSRQGLLSFEVEGPFESIAFDAQRGEELAPICRSVDAGACVGPIYALSIGGVSLFADPGCPSVLVQLIASECRGRTDRHLSSCAFDAATEPRSCVELNLVDGDGGQTGEGAYYDAAGVLFDVVIAEVEPRLTDSTEDVIRSGTLRGTFTRNGSDGPSQPFELTFSACSRPRSICLL
ncbi:MAG TPA: hypothetical protein VJU61_16300 [Polyangiaceae bacterium]|nr:hypothetical protein [Polyangiaceae bacterium]